MNIVFNLGFLAVLIAGGIRYFWAQHLQIHPLALMHLEDWEIWVYGISIVWFMAAFWNAFIRDRCPDCRATNVARTGSRTLDSWHEIKKVRERMNNGNYTTRNLNVTMEKIEHSYRCYDCKSQWVQHEKREKKG